MSGRRNRLLPELERLLRGARARTRTADRRGDREVDRRAHRCIPEGGHQIGRSPLRERARQRARHRETELHRREPARNEDGKHRFPPHSREHRELRRRRRALETGEGRACATRLGKKQQRNIRGARHKRQDRQESPLESLSQARRREPLPAVPQAHRLTGRGASSFHHAKCIEWRVRARSTAVSPRRTREWDHRTGMSAERLPRRDISIASRETGSASRRTPRSRIGATPCSVFASARVLVEQDQSPRAEMGPFASFPAARRLRTPPVCMNVKVTDSIECAANRERRSADTPLDPGVPAAVPTRDIRRWRKQPQEAQQESSGRSRASGSRS